MMASSRKRHYQLHDSYKRKTWHLTQTKQLGATGLFHINGGKLALANRPGICHPLNKTEAKTECKMWIRNWNIARQNSFIHHLSWHLNCLSSSLEPEVVPIPYHARFWCLEQRLVLPYQASPARSVKLVCHGKATGTTVIDKRTWGLSNTRKNKSF